MFYLFVTFKVIQFRFLVQTCIIGLELDMPIKFIQIGTSIFRVSTIIHFIHETYGIHSVNEMKVMLCIIFYLYKKNAVFLFNYLFKIVGIDFSLSVFSQSNHYILCFQVFFPYFPTSFYNILSICTMRYSRYFKNYCHFALASY